MPEFYNHNKIQKLFIFFWISMSIHSQQGWMAGVAPSLELKENLLGINTRIYYGPNDHFCFGPEVSFFPYQEIDNEYELKVTELNFNAHYIVELTHDFGIYPLSGINLTIEKERLIEVTDENKEEDGFGLNYGLGIHYNLGKLFAFAEFKGVTGKLKDEFMTIGVIFLFSKPKDKQEH